MLRDRIKNLIKRAIRELQRQEKLAEFDISQILVEHPENELNGDYSTNIALQISGKIKERPMKIAELINAQLSAVNYDFLEKIEVAQPGFINFFVSKSFLQKQLKYILKQKQKFGNLKIGRDKKISIEFISANPTGPLHIGHGRGAFFGDALSNVLERAGYKVTREYFVNDALKSNQIQELGKTALGKGKTYLDKNLELIIQKLKPKLKKIESEGEAGFLLAQEVQKDIKNFVEKKLKIKFDNWVSEQKLYNSSKVKKAYSLLKKKELVYKKDEAEWLKTSAFGDKKDWVIIRANGQPTYLLSDIAYHREKFSKNFSKVIDIWGADHQGHISKMKAVAKILNYKGDFDILITQIVRLKKGKKLSKRKGEIITLEELINEVGLDVARFFYLTKSLNSQMIFDLDLAKEQSEKNPVYYIQYAHARICSILNRFEGSIAKANLCGSRNLLQLNHTSELNLIKELIKFPEIIEDTAKDYQVQRVPSYAVSLATAFHRFYRDCQVLTENKNLRQARLALILATQIVLKNVLNLMGISAPEKM